MKVPGKKTELEARLKELKDIQSKGSISLQEEKLLIKQISDLERSLPFAGPLEELDEQSKEVREQLKTAKGKSNLKFEALKQLREECKDVQEKIDKMREVLFRNRCSGVLTFYFRNTKRERKKLPPPLIR